MNENLIRIIPIPNEYEEETISFCRLDGLIQLSALKRLCNERPTLRIHITPRPFENQEPVAETVSTDQ